MKPFADLLDRLSHAAGEQAKRALLVDYCRQVPDPDRGIALAALIGDLSVAKVRPARIRELVAVRVDPILFALSHDFVGDVVETTSLIWPRRATNRDWPALSEVVATANAVAPGDLPELVAGWLDTLDATERWALLKLLSGGVRVGVPPDLAKSALAEYGAVESAAVAEVWHAVDPPYGALFDWLEGRAERPSTDDRAVFRPLMRACSLDPALLDSLDPLAYAAEWRWDGTRVQLSARAGERRIYDHAGEDLSKALPDLVDAMNFEGVLDGELLVRRDGVVASPSENQRRLGRKTISTGIPREFPAHVRLFDILFDGREDLRNLGFVERRDRLESFVDREAPRRLDLSEIIHFERPGDLAALRRSCRERGVRGLILKRQDSAYVAGRPSGHWFKWNRDPLIINTVLMYAERGRGGRTTVYTHGTFGLWRADGRATTLVPVGKVLFDLDDTEMERLDKWIRAHAVKRFGPVREVEPSLVVELGFDGVTRSTRHKAGITLSDLRVQGIRWNGSAADVGQIGSLEEWIE